MKFRDLKANEIECRVGMIRDKGLTLLLYKDARCDMNILDETLGVENWQRKHYECKGNLFCSVGININYDKENAEPLWIWKDDCGTESNTEKEKGESSDSFKRACFNISIGRELYTAPFIWIDNTKCNIENRGNKFVCNDKFRVSNITIENKVITALTIVNSKTNKVVFSYGTTKIPTAPPKEKQYVCKECGITILRAKDKNGKDWLPQDIYNKTNGLCLDCYKKVRNNG